MSLEKPTYENLEFMLTDLKKRIRIVNEALIDPADFRLEDYDDIREVYEMVVNRPQLTMMQMEGVLAELGELRKRRQQTK